jgi:hypothetical protein
MNDIVIRKAKRSDLPVIKRLLAELINAMDDTECIDMRVAPGIWDHLLTDARSHFLVAAAGGPPTAEYQGKGIGKQLVLAAIERCRQLGCCEVEVSTEQTNLKARRFYRKCGFDKTQILFELDL